MEASLPTPRAISTRNNFYSRVLTPAAISGRQTATQSIQMFATEPGAGRSEPRPVSDWITQCIGVFGTRFVKVADLGAVEDESQRAGKATL